MHNTRNIDIDLQHKHVLPARIDEEVQNLRHPVSDCHIMDLPLEVRNTIYSDLLAALRDRFIIWLEYFIMGRPPLRLPAISYVNKQALCEVVARIMRQKLICMAGNVWTMPTIPTGLHHLLVYEAYANITILVLHPALEMFASRKYQNSM